MPITRFIIKDMKTGLYAGIYGFVRKYWEKNINNAKLFPSLWAAQRRMGRQNPEDLKVITVKLTETEEDNKWKS